MTQEEIRLNSWRQSDHYIWVRKVIQEEMETSYLSEAMAMRYERGEPMSNEEIGELARIEYQIKIRLQSILDNIE